MQAICFDAPFTSASSGGVDLPFFTIFIVGCISTYIIEIYCTWR